MLIKSLIRRLSSNQLPFNAFLSIVMLVALHGIGALKVFLIMVLNFAIPTYFKGSFLTPIITWIFNGVVLFTNALYHGYPFEDLFPPLAFLVGPFQTVNERMCNLLIGFIQGRISKMAYHIQHYDAPFDLVQYGLLLVISFFGEGSRYVLLELLAVLTDFHPL